MVCKVVQRGEKIGYGDEAWAEANFLVGLVRLDYAPIAKACFLMPTNIVKHGMKYSRLGGHAIFPSPVGRVTFISTATGDFFLRHHIGYPQFLHC